MSGKPLSKWHEEQSKHKFPYKLLSIVVAPTDRKVLHERIETRFEQMLDNGFMEEITDLYNRGDLNLDLPLVHLVKVF